LGKIVGGTGMPSDSDGFISRVGIRNNLTVKVSVYNDKKSIMVVAFDKYDRMPRENTLRFFDVSEDAQASKWVEYLVSEYVI
jgi:hypothetical protein